MQTGCMASTEIYFSPELYDQAVRVVAETRQASLTSIRRRLKGVGYSCITRMIERMQASGVVGPVQPDGSREVLVPRPAERPLPAPPPREKAKPLSHYYGYSAELLAEMTGAHVTSARRWKREGAPAPIAKLLRILIERDLGEIDAAWKGWNLYRGRLFGHDGLNFSPGEVMVTAYHRLQLAEADRLATERRLAEERARATALAANPNKRPTIVRLPPQPPREATSSAAPDRTARYGQP